MKKRKNLLKNAKKFLSAAILSGCVLSYASMNASADAILGGKLIADMTDLTCYYSQEYAGTYGITTMRGATAWNTIMNSQLLFDMTWNYTSDNSESTVNAVDDYLPFSFAMATTTAFKNKGNILATDQTKNDRRFCVITINTACDPDYTTLTHEFGHVLGLGESEDPNSIMCQLVNGRVATKPALVDIIALNRIYCLS